MDNFKLASKEQLRFPTPKGLLSPEQLWGLTKTDLNDLAVSYDEEYQKSGKRSYLAKTSPKDKTAKLRFDIVLDILNTKVEEDMAAAQAAEDKAHNKKIIQLISDKQDESLKGKSIKQLEAMLR